MIIFQKRFKKIQALIFQYSIFFHSPFCCGKLFIKRSFINPMVSIQGCNLVIWVQFRYGAFLKRSKKIFPTSEIIKKVGFKFINQYEKKNIIIIIIIIINNKIDKGN